MFKEHFGKIMTSIGTTVGLAALYGIWSALITVIEVRAEDFVVKATDARISTLEENQNKTRLTTNALKLQIEKLQLQQQQYQKEFQEQQDGIQESQQLMLQILQGIASNPNNLRLPGQ